MSKQVPRRATREDVEIGFRIRKIRQDKHLTQGDVAERMHITYQQLQKYELGKNKIPARRLKELVKILDVDEQSILYGSEKNLETIIKSQNERISLLWHKLDDIKKRNIVLMLLEQLTSLSN